MPLFALEPFGFEPALLDGDEGEIISYFQLRSAAPATKSVIETQRALIFLFSRKRLEEAVAYIGAMNLGHVVCLLDASMNYAFKEKLVNLYKPHYIIEGLPYTDSQEEYTPAKGYKEVESPWDTLIIHSNTSIYDAPELHPDLQLLLTTSGTTGNPKLIRLSKKNIINNASSIMQYLSIFPEERAIGHLPFHYSYGLSVLHSHLFAGASIVLSQSSPAQQTLWDIIKIYKCTSLAGVPYTYKIMDRMGFEKMDLPNLRTLTQAGGGLEKSLILKFHDIMHRKGGRFFVMYGQTEATARISYLPPKYLPEKAGSIGIAIPSGTLQIYDKEKAITNPKKLGEVVYKGPNVMMGYALNPSDLIKGDEMQGVLHTGDIGYFDEDKFFYLKGRLNRISKVYGLRINLDDIEKELSRFGTVAVTATDTHIDIHLEDGALELPEKCIRHVSKIYRLHSSTFRCRAIPQLPRTSTGKIDYKKLSEI